MAQASARVQIPAQAQELFTASFIRLMVWIALHPRFGAPATPSATFIDQILKRRRVTVLFRTFDFGAQFGGKALRQFTGVSGVHGLDCISCRLALH